MKQAIWVVIVLAVTLIAAACSPAPTPTPTQPPPPLPPTLPPKPTATAVPPTAALVPPTAVPPTLAPQPTASTPQATTAASTSSPATATSAPPTVAATAPPVASPLAAPGLYVTSMRLDPPQPVHGQEISFFVSFLNTAATDQNPKWVVFVYRADSPTRPNTQTSVTQTTIQPGTLEIKAPSGVIKFGATGNACDFYFARVDSLDINNKGTDMVKPDGPVFEKGFTVCQ